jgi:SAM-dependent methyltransferase
VSDAYAAIAEDYRQAKLHPWRLHVEEFTLHELTGDVAGLAVLDLACGEGFHTRRLKVRGAARVVGVDLSPAMVALARAEEQRHPLGVEYVASDAADFRTDEPFDLVVAAYLLNYARTPEQLLGMCRGVARSLKPGCRFVAVNNHLEQPMHTYAATEKYGLVKRLDGELREGAAITYTLFTGDHPINFDNYYLSPRTYERVLAEAGLGRVRWHAPRVSAAGAAAFPPGYWSAFLEHPPVYFLDCVRLP